MPCHSDFYCVANKSFVSFLFDKICFYTCKPRLCITLTTDFLCSCKQTDNMRILIYIIWLNRHAWHSIDVIFIILFYLYYWLPRQPCWFLFNYELLDVFCWSCNTAKEKDRHLFFDFLVDINPRIGHKKEEK
jgi:hypothetical protein